MSADSKNRRVDAAKADLAPRRSILALTAKEASNLQDTYTGY